MIKNNEIIDKIKKRGSTEYKSKPSKKNEGEWLKALFIFLKGESKKNIDRDIFNLNDNNREINSLLAKYNIDTRWKPVSTFINYSNSDLYNAISYYLKNFKKFLDSCNEEINNFKSDIKNIEKNIKITDIQKEVLIKFRISQSKLRKQSLKEFNNCCVITKIKTEVCLIASHIKSWKECIDEGNYKLAIEKNNILLLSATIDKLFDKHLISFNQNGKLFFKEKEDIINTIEKIVPNYKNFFLDKKYLTNERKYFLNLHYKKFLQG